MASEWTDTKWGKLVTLQYGGLGTHDYGATGSYRAYGTNGQVGRTDIAEVNGPGIIIGRKGAYRGVHYSPDAFGVIGTAFYLQPKTEFDLKWAYYQLLTQNINAMDSGSAIPSTSRPDFYQLSVLVPPLDEQRRIASILGALDDKIELNRRMSQTLDEMAQAIFKSWFVDFDHHPSIEPTAGLPAGWSRRPIGDVVRVEGGTTPSTKRDEYWAGGVHQFGTPKDMSGLDVPVLLQTERRVTDAGLAAIGSGLLPAGTVLMSSRAPIGYLAIAEEPIAVNQGIIAMVCQSALSAEFILGWARHSQAEIASRANGSTFMEISKGNFRQISVVVPDSRSLADFDKIVKPLHRRMVACEIQTRQLSMLRDALLPRLLAGKMVCHHAHKAAS